MFRRLFLIALLGALPLTCRATSLADKLQSADHVLLIRHAYAPGVGDPPNFSVNDCSTQRNLDAEGKAQAVRVGQWLRQQGLRRVQLFSSIWCRCQDTASGMGLGPHRIEPSLASFFDQPDAAAASNRALQAFIARTLPGKSAQALILVTHHVNIREFVGENIGVGDMILARVGKDGKPLSYERIPSP